MGPSWGSPPTKCAERRAGRVAYFSAYTSYEGSPPAVWMPAISVSRRRQQAHQQADVLASLDIRHHVGRLGRARRADHRNRQAVEFGAQLVVGHGVLDRSLGVVDLRHVTGAVFHFYGQPARHAEIGRASCRERGCQYVEISVDAASLKKKNK